MSKNKNSPLGRGLSSLLGEKKDLSHLMTSDQKYKIKNLPIELISSGPWQTRKDFNNEEDPRISFGFSGVQNVNRAGTSIPLVYGEIITGSVVISAGVDTNQVQA